MGADEVQGEAELGERAAAGDRITGARRETRAVRIGDRHSQDDVTAVRRRAAKQLKVPTCPGSRYEE